MGESLSLSNVFGNITLLSEGTHSYAEVYLAERMGKRFALKRLKEEYAGVGEYRLLLHKEFEIGYRFDHPHIARTIGMEEVDGLGECIIMEYVEGCTLREAMNRGMWNRERIVRVMSQLAAALDYIHTQQTIHRDLKPANIMLTFNGDNVKVIDFGLADADNYAILKQPAGTRRYAAPEQMVAGGTVSAQTDIYAFGVILDELHRLSPHKVLQLEKIARKCQCDCPQDRYAHLSEIVWNRGSTYRKTARIAAGLLLSVLIAINTILLLRQTRETPSQARLSPPTTEVRHDTIHDTMVVRESAMTAVQTVPADQAASRQETATEASDKRLAELIDYAKDLASRKATEAETNPRWGVEIMEGIEQKTREFLSPTDPLYHLYKSAAEDAAMSIFREYNAKQNSRFLDSIQGGR